MDKFKFWQRWLLGLSLFLLAFGLLMAFTGVFASNLLNDQTIKVFWGGEALSGGTRGFYTWAFGVWGASIAGWAVTLAFLACYPFGKKEKWAWVAIVLAILAWYPIDTGFSYYFKFYFNVILNSVLLLLIALPLIFTRKEFFKL